MDTYPARLNQFSVLINRFGIFYGLNMAKAVVNL